VAATQPVTNNTNEDLADNDTDDFEVVDGLCPDFIANLKGRPTCRESSLEEGPDVANGEKNVSEWILARLRIKMTR
jgi:hypothetical protein